MKVSNNFNTLTLKQIFWKMKVTKIEDTSFPFKTACQKPMLRQIKWRLQKGPMTKSGDLPVTT